MRILVIAALVLLQGCAFLKEVQGDVYLREPYDPAKTPILFIHGAGGTPQDWRYFIEHLDRDRYQPWVYYYPSGLPLEVNALQLNRLVGALHEKHGFDELIVTAHSMGGLVARRFIALNAAGGQDYIKRLVTLATPWGGVPAAQIGVDHAPFVVPSWRDVAPNSYFLRALHAQALPAGIRHDLFFAHRDSVVTLASQLEHAGAAQLHGFDEGHAGILRSRSAFLRYAGVLALN